MAAIELRGVTKRFGDVTALDATSLAIADGELVSILGPSGCGKSTLLFVVAGLESASDGVVTCNGTQVTGPGRERNVVFQEYALFPWRDVLGNVTIGLEGHFPKADLVERARHYLSLVGLSGFENHYPHQLSGGMKQRTALARALAMEPEVLLMDEPFGALDAQTRESLQEELLRIWSGNKLTVLFVTHGIEEAIFLSERIVVMKPGGIKKIVSVDAPYPREFAFRTSELAARLRTELHELLR